MSNSPAHVEEDVWEGTCRMFSFRAVVSAREIDVEKLFLSQKMRVIAENARP
ncbi:hypothetical protein X975_03202, partial [Stegodyphus mimosarum]